ncbi:MAG TPA: AAA family ATPase, partial [Thermomicrobiales bacterium]|nr:AAA family ATPase [Thermomicrobiales bacterium]
MTDARPYPSGTVAFFFTDIEGSTRLWERDRATMQAAVERHLAQLQAAVDAQGGVLFKTVGDAIQAAFPTAPDAVAAALAAQRAILHEDGPDAEPLRARMALHVGEATPADGDYLAPCLNRLARLLAAGHGGQILLSGVTADLARDRLPPGADLRDLGEHPLRDLFRPERIFQLLHPDLPDVFPPLRTLAHHPTNLPAQPTPFVGRERELERVAGLLRDEAVRLLTLTGPGGVGKTRLALQAAADALDEFPDGVFLIELAPLTDAAHVPAAIAAALGVREEGGEPL